MRVRETVTIIGAGGHGKVVADVARSAGFEVVGFTDDAPGRAGGSFQGLPVLGLEDWLHSAARAGLRAALGIGDNNARGRAFERLRAAGVSMPVLVHERASVAASARLGDGTVVMALAVVNPDATVGEGAIVNSGAIVEHDCEVGPFAHLSPNATLGGAVVIGHRSHVGLGAVVLPGVRVGANVRVGAGAVVLADIEAGLTAVGVPARTLKKGTP